MTAFQPFPGAHCLAHSPLKWVGSALGRCTIAVVLASSPSIGSAQSLLRFDSPTPPIYLRVCWTLEAAVSQARLAEKQAKSQSTYAFVADFEHAQCEYLNVSVWPDSLEQTIKPFLGWAIAYEPTSAKTIATLLSGRRVNIPVAMVKDTMSYYRGRVSVGQQIKAGWFELPREPYVLKYLVEIGATRR